LPPHLQRPGWISGTAAPAGLIWGLFNSISQGEYGKIVGEPSFAIVPEIRAIQHLFVQIYILPVA